MNIPNIISFIIGFIIGFIIYKNLKKCKYHGPNSKDIIGKIYKKNGKCYKFIPVVSICPISISMKK
jgi:hypothetical protein